MLNRINFKRRTILYPISLVLLFVLVFAGLILVDMISYEIDLYVAQTNQQCYVHVDGVIYAGNDCSLDYGYEDQAGEWIEEKAVTVDNQRYIGDHQMTACWNNSDRSETTCLGHTFSDN